MEELKDSILKLFKIKKSFYSYDELVKLLKIKGENNNNLFRKAIEELIQDGCLYFDNKKGYTLFRTDLGFAFGSIEINKNGNGFVHTNNGYTIFIPSTSINGALNGDNVIVDSIKPSRKGSFEGKVKTITKRKNGKAYFKVVGNGLSSKLVSYNNLSNINVHIHKNDKKDLLDGEIIELNVGLKENDGIYEADFNKVFGHISDPDVSLKVLADELGVYYEISDEEMAEAKKIPKSVSEDEIIDFVDQRHLNFVTIDCDDTKDRDDAIYVEKKSNGNYVLYVATSKVNYYVKPGSKLYYGMMKRGSSHYPDGTCFPLLPHSISNGICSLNENVDRITRTVEIEYDKDGNVVRSNDYNSVIKSKKIMAYSKVDKLLDDNPPEEYTPFTDILKNANELSDILGKKKHLDFNINKVIVKRDKNNNEFFTFESNGKSGKMIERFMLEVDHFVAQKYGDFPFIFRVHGLPNENLIRDVVRRMNLNGIHFSLPKNITTDSIISIIKLLNSKEEYKEYLVLLLKSMAKAVYSTQNYGHFALMVDVHCHNTASIRRLVDYMIDVIVDDIETHNYDYEYMEKYIPVIDDVVKIANDIEKKDALLEEEAKKMAMARKMENNIHKIYDATITDVYKHGVFVRTNDLVEGKISFENMSDGKVRYSYDPNLDAVVSNNKKEQYRIGNKIQVECLDASVPNRTVDFGFVRKR